MILRSPFARCVLALLLGGYLVPACSAAVVVISNAAAKPVNLTIAPPGSAEYLAEVAPGQSLPVPSGKYVDVTFKQANQPRTLRLDAYAAYVFAEVEGKLDLYGIEMVGPAIPLADVPVAIPKPRPAVKIPVRILVDDADRRTRRLWEPVLKGRVEQAAKLLSQHCPVECTVVAADEWFSDPKAVDLYGVWPGFQAHVKDRHQGLTLGFTSRVPSGDGEGPFALRAGPLEGIILIRDGEPRTEPERVEVLLQQMARYLGAVTSPDPGSVMRKTLGDGKAAFAQFHIGCDPLNTLAMNIWVEEMQQGKIGQVSDLSPGAQTRLSQIYATLQKAIPDEPLPESLRPLAARVLARPVVQEEVIPARAEMPEVEPRVIQVPMPGEIAEGERPIRADREAVRKVIRAIVQRAQQNVAANDRKRGDRLTALYIQTAADVARFEAKEHQAAAFLIGLGLALDDSQVLRKNPLTAAFCEAVESDEERNQRLAVIGLPTIHNRRDLCQHFVVSAALTELIGAGLAEQAGLAKEVMDMSRPSGFSYTDMAANLSGIDFARVTKRNPELLEQWWNQADVTKFVPSIEGLRDGLTRERFQQDYGSLTDARFTRALNEVRERVRALPLYEANLRD